MASETENMHISWPVIDILSQFLGPDMDFWYHRSILNMSLAWLISTSDSSISIYSLRWRPQWPPKHKKCNWHKITIFGSWVLRPQIQNIWLVSTSDSSIHQ
jgi:hypothetical protein